MLEYYSLLKLVHVSCVALSGLGFVVRGLWMWRQSPWLQRPWVRIVPHGVDSCLLASAVTLAALSGQYPFTVDWLTAKFFGLLAYIVLGAVALRRGRSLVTRRLALSAALVVYAYIVSVALTRQPWPWG